MFLINTCILIIASKKKNGKSCPGCDFAKRCWTRWSLKLFQPVVLWFCSMNIVFFANQYIALALNSLLKVNCKYMFATNTFYFSGPNLHLKKIFKNTKVILIKAKTSKLFPSPIYIYSNCYKKTYCTLV